jgi:hypothetical protein
MKFLVLALPLALAACGTLPEPFYGNPGIEGARLAIPPAPVLMVPPPQGALLASKAAGLYAQDLAAALVNYDVPSIAGPAAKGEWQLRTSARVVGDTVVPGYAIIGPDLKTYGQQDGAAVPASTWEGGDASALNGAALADAQTLAKTMAAVNARVQQSNPKSLENRTPRIFVGAVSGAPGDGDTALPMNLARDLPGSEDEVVSNPHDADFTVTGLVKSKPDANGQLLVELDWSVLDANQRKIGQVTQLHDLSPADITPYWGDVAAAAATEAASGVQQVVENATLKKAK